MEYSEWKDDGAILSEVEYKTICEVFEFDSCNIAMGRIGDGIVIGGSWLEWLLYYKSAWLFIWWSNFKRTDISESCLHLFIIVKIRVPVWKPLWYDSWITVY